jgi:type IV pilus assembly protein PilV
MRGKSLHSQSGVMLLEALVGLLIFSLGILALVAMQSLSISSVSNAKYRVEAAFLADELLNRIWMDSYGAGANANLANVQNYRYPGGSAPQLTAWIAKLQNPATGLPGSVAYPPTITVTNVAGPPMTSQVLVTVRWKAPNALTASQHIAIGYVADP